MGLEKAYPSEGEKDSTEKNA